MRCLPISLAAIAAVLPALAPATTVDARLLTIFGNLNGALPALPALPQPANGTAFAPEISASAYVQRPLIQAGHPSPSSPSIVPDSPGQRVLPNVASSPFAGVGSLFIDPDPSDPFGIICTATPISRTSILTAGHCFDTDGDGRNDIEPANTLFVLNYDSAFSQVIPAAGIQTHPDYTGFANPTVNDDLTVVRLSQPLPPEIPIYEFADPSWLYPGAPVVMVGYGASGTGATGYTEPPSFDVKRGGANLIESVGWDDEGSGEIELVAWDFEYEGNNVVDPITGLVVDNSDDLLGLIPAALPNWLESAIGGGDSGGPSFIFNPLDPGDLTPYLAAVNTFGFWEPGVPGHDREGYFGSGSGAIWLNRSYQSWIAGIPDRTTGLLDAGLASLALLLAIRRRKATDQTRSTLA